MKILNNNFLYCMKYFLVFFFIFTQSALACRGVEGPKNSLAEALERAKLVFIGKISDSSFSGAETRAEFQVLKVLKGDLPKELSFMIQTGRSCDLGRYVEQGSEWLIFADKPGDLIVTASHSRRLFDPDERKNIEQELESILKKSKKVR
jgi:hypothetical protein